MADANSEVWEEIKAARAEIANSPGAALRNELAAVARSYRLFHANATELERFLAQYDDPSARVELWALQNRDSFDAFLDEVDRLFHNFLAAAATLRDHTRRLWDEYSPPDPALTAEYDKRVREAFAESPLVQFVQRLRNYSTHTKLPLALGRFSWTPETGDQSTTVLPKAALLEWDGWTATARRFITSHDGDLDLRQILWAYVACVDEFNQWFGHAFLRGHLPAFDDFNARRAAYAQLLRRHGYRPEEESRPDAQTDEPPQSG
jgi:hypothetical protein